MWSPLGDFFASAPGLNPYRTLPMGVSDEGWIAQPSSSLSARTRVVTSVRTSSASRWKARMPCSARSGRIARRTSSSRSSSRPLGAGRGMKRGLSGIT